MKNLKMFSSGIAMLVLFTSFISVKAIVRTIEPQRTITGTVRDLANLPIPGANVVNKNNSKGVQTNFDGHYSIQAKKGDVLVFSFLGMKTKSVKVKDANTIHVKLEDDSVLLEGVVVTAMGIKKQKRAVGYAIAAESKQDYSGRNHKAKILSEKDEQTVNPVTVLNGKVAGINISPGASTKVIIRGFSSLSQNQQPLYVIDGVPVAAGEAKTLNPDDIKDLKVLKESAATALYGSLANKGVVMITTNSGDFESENPIVIPNTEDYGTFVENPFEAPKNAPLSTFSIDVDNASYTNIRRFINNGQPVPKDAVRVEEMVNFFKYQYPQPKDAHPFSINTEYSASPWNTKHQLLRIGLQGKNLPMQNLPASNLVFLIDVSGSMSDDNKLPLVKQSLKILTQELRRQDKVSIVVYAGAAGLVLPPTSGDDKQIIIDALDKLESGGSTAGGAGILLAYKIAEQNFIKEGNNRVILATDGDFNVGTSSNSDMETLIVEKRKSGVFLTCLGYGMGNYKDSKMEILADKGNGNYAYIDNIQEANRFLGKEFKGSMFAIAKDVKIQIEFNPKQVQAYRLIGYENRKLRPEDFTNDKIDAGELGSGHTVTALYEIIPAGAKSDFLETTPELKYTKTEPTGTVYNDELATVKFRYKKPDGEKSTEMLHVIANKASELQNASDDFRFSSAVAWFGLKLRDSKLISNKSAEDIKSLAKSGLTNDADGYKAEFVRLVESGAKI